ncbi:MAG: OmpH family outer membrane protein [Candidatus Babeliaceae bacterium]
MATKVAAYSPNKIQTKSLELQEGRKRVEQEIAKTHPDFAGKIKKFENLAMDLNNHAKNKMLDKEAYEKKEAEFKKLSMELEQMQNKIQKDTNFQREISLINQTIQMQFSENFGEALENVIKKQGWDFAIEVQGYFNERCDISDDIVDELNKKYKAQIKENEKENEKESPASTEE